MSNTDDIFNYVKSNISNNQGEFEKYVMLEAIYKQKYRDQNNIFPNEWYEKYNYSERIRLLEEAINSNELIKVKSISRRN